jgi:hypothetical protein
MSPTYAGAKGWGSMQEKREEFNLIVAQQSVRMLSGDRKAVLGARAGVRIMDVTCPMPLLGAKAGAKGPNRPASWGAYGHYSVQSGVVGIHPLAASSSKDVRLPPHS